MGAVHSCGVHEALVISGGCLPSSSVRVLVADWAWAWWGLSSVQRLPLSLITLGEQIS